MKLTSQNVTRIYFDCLAHVHADSIGTTRGEGVQIDAMFLNYKLEEHRAEIEAMLDELPENFQSDVGGGWSFLNLCETRAGEPWTGLHETMDLLVRLSTAIGKMSFLLPRELWPALPGGMPYLVID